MAARSPAKNMSDSSCSTREMWPRSGNPAGERMDGWSTTWPGEPRHNLFKSEAKPLAPTSPASPQSQFPTRGPHPGPAPSQDLSVQVCSSSSLGIQVFSPSPPASWVSGVQRLNLSLPSQVLGAQIHNLHFPGIPEVSFQSGVQLEAPPTRDPEPQSSSPRTKFLLGEVYSSPSHDPTPLYLGSF